MVQGQGLVTILVLMTSCLSSSITAENKVPQRAERSSGILLDESSGVIRPSNEGPDYLPAIHDIVPATFKEFSEKQVPGEFLEQPNSKGRGNGALMTVGNTESVSDPTAVSKRHVRAKRFNEFVGKRSSLGEEVAVENDEDNQKSLSDDPDLRRILESLSAAQISMLENGDDPYLMSKERLMSRIYAFLQNGGVDKRQYEFVGKRQYDFVGKRPYDFLGKRHPYEFLGKRYEFVGKRMPYEFLGKRNYDFLGKRFYDFLGKRAPYEFVGKRSHNDDAISIPEQGQQALPSENGHLSALSMGESAPAQKRYSEFLGKRKRTEEEGEAAMTDNARLATLLQSNGLGKRLSRMLLTQRLGQQYPEYPGK